MIHKLFKTIFLLVALATTSANAQTGIMQMMEGEIRAGLTTTLGGYHTGKAQVSAALGIEGRYNFKGTPWDCSTYPQLAEAMNIFTATAMTVGRITVH